MKINIVKIGVLILATYLFTPLSSHAQRFMTRNGHISFFSKAPLENIEAHNRQVNAAFDAEKGDFVFKVLMKSFEFEKALMQEHFNENYVESHKYPNATFTGRVTNLSGINLAKDGSYPVSVEGDLTIHGVTRAVKESGTFAVKGDEITGNCVFNIRLSDYNITIPRAVAGNIAESVEIRVDASMRKL